MSKYYEQDIRQIYQKRFEKEADHFFADLRSMKLEVETSFIYKSITQIDADIVDRLNNRYTAIGIVACFLIIAAKVYVGNPINCWGPSQFQSIHFAYVNSICWLQGTYYLPTKKIDIPDRSVPRTYFISYYQWTSITLLCMAILFTLPSHLWNTLSNANGISLKTLIKMIKDDRHDTEKIHHIRKLVMVQMTISRSKHLRSFLHRQLRRNDSCGRLTSLLFMIKFLFFINALGQFLFLIHFLSLHYTNFNFALFNRDLHRVVGGFESSQFPRVVMCDFMIRELGSNQHWYTVQCNLPINIFNEVIFTGIVLWLFLLVLFNGISIILWAMSLTEMNRNRVLKRSLHVYENLETKIINEHHHHPLEKDFVHYIGLDGYILLRIIGKNTDDIFMIETIGFLYNHYLKTLDKTEEHVV